MSTLARYHSLLADPFEADFLNHPLTMTPEVWEAFCQEPGEEPDVSEEAELFAENVCEQCQDAQWQASTPGSIRRLLGAQPPRFERVVSDPEPLLEAWSLLCGTLGAGPTRKYALPWWLEAAYPPQDYFVGLTPPRGLDELVEAMHATRLMDVVVTLLETDQDDKYYLADLLQLCHFLSEAASRQTWVLGIECAS